MKYGKIFQLCSIKIIYTFSFFFRFELTPRFDSYYGHGHLRHINFQTVQSVRMSQMDVK